MPRLFKYLDGDLQVVYQVSEAIMIRKFASQFSDSLRYLESLAIEAEQADDVAIIRVCRDLRAEIVRLRRLLLLSH